MSDLTAIINEVYITPIKSVLFVDDQFPTFGRLCAQNLAVETPVAQTYTDDDDFTDTQSQRLLPAKQEPSLVADDTVKDSPGSEIRSHYDRAKYLTDSCRDRGFIFDVESDFSKLLPGTTEGGFFNKPDLIVLDYYLESGVDDGGRALDIIRRLNNSPRFNLVIVHTSITPLNAAQEIAYALRGAVAYEETEGYANRSRNGFAEFQELLNGHMLDYLNEKVIDVSSWREKLNSKKLTEPDIIACFEKHMARCFSTTQTEPQDVLLGCGCGDASRPWIRGKNVFIVVVQKPDPDKESIDMLLEALRESLEEYKPAPLTLLLQHTVNIFKTHGEEVLDGAFGDSKTRAALLLHSLLRSAPTSGGRNEELGIRVADLSHRALATLAHGLHPFIKGVGVSILEGIPVTADHAANSRLALEREKAPTGISKETLALYMNAFLCSQKVTRTHMTTGIVFRNSETPVEAWVCVTPACDLVPGQVSEEGRDYRNSLAPYGYFEALRLKPVDASEAKKATNCRHLFVNFDGEVLVYEIAVGNGNILFPYIFYTQDSGLFNSANMLTLEMVKKQTCAGCGKTQCEMTEIQAQVMGQLRPEYASRLLIQKGAWGSRIGVDFVDYN